jgi:NAD+ synthase
MRTKDYEFDPAEQVKLIENFIKTYFAENGNPNTKAVIGISGGKDSTIAAALLVRALGADRVIGVLMPQSVQIDIEDSRRVCEYLGIKSYEIDIGRTFDTLTEDLPTDLFDLHDDNSIYFCNTPARLRMTTLYAVAGIVGGRVVNTGNWSEGWIGYTTKYGDLAGDFHLFQDLTVREVLMMGRVMKEIPRRLVDKAPADGMTGQTDEDNMGVTYEQIDSYLLEDIIPDVDTWRNMSQRHERNEHKKCINLPGPFAHGRHYEKGKHGGIFETF